MQNLRTVKLESKRKDKYLSKKNFLIQGLAEKVALLERSNASLFRELDQSIADVSCIRATSPNRIVDNYLDGKQDNDQDEDDQEVRGDSQGSHQQHQTPPPNLKAQLLEL
jgi:hypothetical protein